MYSSVTHIFSRRDREALTAHIETCAAPSKSPYWNPGWPQEVEAALLDAVFSARATYGGPDTGVRRVVSRWRKYRQCESLDDPAALAALVDKPEELAEILGNRQRVAGNSTTKAECAARIATALTGLRVARAEDLIASDELRAAFTAIPGAGTKTWECALFLVGERTPDSLLHVIAFTSDAVGRTLDGESAEMLLAVTAESMNVERAALEHAVWRYQRRFPLPGQGAELKTAG
ncbi:hypothetical protein [Rhodococcus sp. H29-C3]|uniref:hypothetical protein n=1 Tax=Rhodococcus sp. H29-C3 TaxID=3046307 RepID=UPI0024BB7D24|nr:hypothetical protein [Rhodococcus sp. H29-C3]MDJ0360636.1 hypothetical protein [Rhodococcus sp. H29-C3]